MRIGVTGSHGLIGGALLARPAADGHHGARLPREVGADDVRGLDAVVHLAGEPISKRWTAARKAEILRSRVEGTRQVARAIAALPEPRPALVVASAIGSYGDRQDETLDETSPRGGGFLADVVEAWEAAAQPARDAGARVVHARFGIVLSRDGGALPRLVAPMRMGAGGRVGSGRQWWSWVELSDVAGALEAAATDPRHIGVINVVAPNPARNEEFVRTLARVLHRPAFFPLPATAARLVLGEMADELLLFSQRVRPARLESLGYRFQYPELEPALRHALGAESRSTTRPASMSTS